MRPRLILHIGTHKTGTSAIQGWLAGHGAALAGVGAHYGATHRPPHPGLAKHTSLFAALTGKGNAPAQEFAAIRADFAASGQPTLILSEEGLSAPRYRLFREIAPLLEGFDVRVVLMLRRQDLFVESLWNQVSKEGVNRLDLGDFARRDWNRRRLDYAAIAAFWEGFGQLVPCAYDPGVPGGSVGQFLRAADLGLEATGAGLWANPSPSMNCAALFVRLNRARLQPLIPVARQLFRTDRRRHGLGRNLRAEILRDAAPGNALLARRYGLHFPDVLPDEPETPMRGPDLRALARALRGAGPVALPRPFREG
ncbi:hypothetical protein KM176_21805 [Pseudooceanicola sp. CBS1P-1]|uniref:Sulfotransferase family protein n=1 Tax=Pseudooceanicola albus TaxID=2692189 RepID=A0A6L7GCL2_9RHOB|nr:MULTISPECIES: hypothetical protein [Pseudooceanicola]MBT9386510.1 hypothetical protein [Pseudooceanicola endophyticus]MXN20543.1 hypothetical protein [Pseudooceanicola albus]